RAIEHLLAAAEEAERGWAKGRAVAFYREALELLPEDDGDRPTDVKRRLAIAHTAAFHALHARLLQLDADYPATGGKSAGVTSPAISQTSSRVCFPRRVL